MTFDGDTLWVCLTNFHELVRSIRSARTRVGLVTVVLRLVLGIFPWLIESIPVFPLFPGKRENCNHSGCGSEAALGHDACVRHVECYMSGSFDPDSCNVCTAWLLEVNTWRAEGVSPFSTPPWLKLVELYKRIKRSHEKREGRKEPFLWRDKSLDRLYTDYKAGARRKSLSLLFLTIPWNLANNGHSVKVWSAVE